MRKVMGFIKSDKLLYKRYKFRRNLILAQAIITLLSLMLNSVTTTLVCVLGLCSCIWMMSCFKNEVIEIMNKCGTYVV